MIINADDFGYSHEVNAAVAQCFPVGRINRATLLVNMPGTEEAVRMAQEEGFFDKVGLHINLTEGYPLTQICARSALCDASGKFTGTFHIPFKARLYLNKATREAIRQEVEAQVQRYLALGFTLLHADSHNYTHTYFSMYASIRKLLQTYGFRTVRISRNLSEDSFSLPFYLYKSLFNALLRRLKTHGTPVGTTAYFGSVQDFEKSEKQRVKEDVELMTHPVLQDGQLMDNTLPQPHPFVTKEWIQENGLYLEDVTGKKRKMLVCFIQTHIGGAMTSLVNFLNALDTERYDVDVMFYEQGEGRFGINPEIHFLPQGKRHEGRSLYGVLRRVLSPGYDIASLRALYYEKVLNNRRAAIQIRSKQGCRYSTPVHWQYDVAVAYEADWPLNYVMTRVKAQKKILWHHLDYQAAGLLYREDRHALQKADALVFVSEECRAAFAQAHSALASKTRFLPNLLSSEYVRQKGEESQVSLPFTNLEHGLIFLTVARISFEHKGLDRAVRAFARLKKEGLADHAKWVIIGKGRDADRLSEMIRQYGLEDVIYPLGVRENPIPYMKLCDVMLLPSRYEGKPMVVTEGYMMGLVPLVTRYTSAGEQIQNGVDGFIVDNNEEALYQGIKRIVEDPSVLHGPREYIRSHDYGNQNEIVKFDKLVEELFS